MQHTTPDADTTEGLSDSQEITEPPGEVTGSVRSPVTAERSPRSSAATSVAGLADAVAFPSSRASPGLSTRS